MDRQLWLNCLHFSLPNFSFFVCLHCDKFNFRWLYNFPRAQLCSSQVLLVFETQQWFKNWWKFLLEYRIKYTNDIFMDIVSYCMLFIGIVIMSLVRHSFFFLSIINNYPGCSSSTQKYSRMYWKDKRNRLVLAMNDKRSPDRLARREKCKTKSFHYICSAYWMSWQIMRDFWKMISSSQRLHLIHVLEKVWYFPFIW